MSAIGATSSGVKTIMQSITALKKLTQLDLSKNSMAFFCADALVTSLKHLDSDCKLRKLSLAGTKMDELTAFQLCQGVIQHSFIETLDLSSNALLGANFAKTLEEMLV